MQSAVTSKPGSEFFVSTSVNCFGWLWSLNRRAITTALDEGVVSSVTVETLIWLTAEDDQSRASRSPDSLLKWNIVTLHLLGMSYGRIATPEEP
jgi:hypothetical protein